MDCRNALDAVEALAAGDLQPDGALRAHFESCVRCAAELASARRLEAALAGAAPPAPARFTPMVLQRIRRDRWRAEQYVDRLFNVAMAASVVLIVGGVFGMLNVDAVLAFAGGTWSVAREAGRAAARSAAPTLGTYVAAVGLLLSAMGMWWWAERRLEF